MDLRNLGQHPQTTLSCPDHEQRLVCLIFPHLDMANWVLTKYWHIEMTLVLLKRWTPLFDPDKEKMGVGPT